MISVISSDKSRCKFGKTDIKYIQIIETFVLAFDNECLILFHVIIIELAMTRMEVAAVKEKSIKDAEEAERRREVSIRKEVESVKRKADVEVTDAKRVATEWKFRHKDHLVKHKEMMHKLEELANIQLQVS